MSSFPTLTYSTNLNDNFQSSSPSKHYASKTSRASAVSPGSCWSVISRVQNRMPFCHVSRLTWTATFFLDLRLRSNDVQTFNTVAVATVDSITTLAFCGGTCWNWNPKQKDKATMAISRVIWNLYLISMLGVPAFSLQLSFYLRHCTVLQDELQDKAQTAAIQSCRDESRCARCGYGVDPGVSQPSQGTATLVSGLRGSHLRTFRNSVLWTREKNGVIPIRTSTCDTWLEQIWQCTISMYLQYAYVCVCVCFLNFVFSADCPLHCTPSLGKKKEGVSHLCACPV